MKELRDIYSIEINFITKFNQNYPLVPPFMLKAPTFNFTLSLQPGWGLSTFYQSPVGKD